LILRHFTLLALFTKETGSVFLHGRYRYHEHCPYKRKEWTALVQIGKKVSMVLPMPDGKVHLPLVTTSELRSFRRCKREHHYSYRMGYREIHKAGPLRFGTAIHKALEVWWSAATLGNIDLALAAIDANGEIDEFERAKARAMTLAYHARWIDAEFEVLAVEKQFEAPLINPATGAKSQTYEVGGAIDAIVRMPNGDVFIVEHKCLAGSTRIFNHATGTYFSLEEMFRKNIAPVVSTLTPSGKIETAQAKVPIAQKAQPTFRITTKEGRTLAASGSHPFWTTRGWVPANQLTLGDWVATPRHMASSFKDEPFSDEQIRLIGYMIGDGCVTYRKNQQISFCKTDENVLSDVTHCALSLGERPRRQPDNRTHATQLYFLIHGFVESFLLSVGVKGLSAEKYLPDIPLSDRQCGQLLAALWSTDGCIDVQIDRKNNDQKKPRIIYTSVSEKLSRGIQELLQRLGLTTSFNQSSVPYKGKRRDTFTVKIISRAAKRRFVHLVQDGTIPLTRSSVNLTDFLESIPTSNQGNDTRMQPSHHPAIWWDRIKSISRGPSEVLYDLEVPGPHTFVAEGIITHNTSGVECGLDSPYWRRLVLDPQISTYFVGARALGYDIKGCLYDVLRKPAIRPKEIPLVDEDGVKIVLDADGQRVRTKDGKKWRETGDSKLNYLVQTRPETPLEFELRCLDAIAEDPERHLVRGEVFRLESDELDAAQDMWDQARELREAEKATRYPRNPDSCEKWGRFCVYFEVCTGSASLEDPTLFRRTLGKHEELTP
jgi:hypothetical protein